MSRDEALKRAVIEAAGYQIMTVGETEQGCYVLNAFEPPTHKNGVKQLETFGNIDLLLEEIHLRVLYKTFEFLNIHESVWFHYSEKMVLDSIKLAFPAYFAAKDEKSVEELAEEALNAACYLIQTKLGVTDGGYASIVFSGDEVKQLFINYINGEVSNIKDSADFE